MIDTSKPLILDEAIMSNPNCNLSELQERSINFLKNNLK